jgi:hypothetical protein
LIYSMGVSDLAVGGAGLAAACARLGLIRNGGEPHHVIRVHPGPNARDPY